MGTVGINFGSATSGTGFDVTSTVTSIMANMRAPETAWATQTTALTAGHGAEHAGNGHVIAVHRSGYAHFV